jgi:hypothetical protein
VAGGRGRRDGDGLDTVEGLEGDLGAEHRLGDRDVQVRVQVDALAAEHLVGPDPELHVQVAGRPTARAGGAPALESQRGRRVHARGDVDVEGPVLEGPALARADGAGVGDDLAGAVAAGAGGRGHHLAEQRLAHPADLTGAAALGAGRGCRPGGRAGGVADLTGDRGAHLHAVLGTEHGLGEVELGGDLQVRAPHRPRRATAAEGALTAEEGVEDVADPSEAGAEGVATAGGTADSGLPVAVVASPLLRVSQHLPGPGDLLEPVLRVGVVGVGVGVQLARLGAVRALDVLGRGVAGDAEQVVVVGHASVGSVRSQR